jgi:arylsulfatase A-like enzyme
VVLVVIAISAAMGVVWLTGSGRDYRLVDHIAAADSSSEQGTFASFVSERNLSGPITLGSDTRVSLTPPLPAKLDFDVSLPPHPSLHFAVGIKSEREVGRAKVELEVTVASDGGSELVYREVFRSFQLNRWYPRRINLSQWSEEAVRLRLEVRPAFGASDPPWAERIQVAWGDPVVTSRAEGRRTARRSPEPDRRPSILFLLVDTLRADYLGSYGFGGDISPGLDRLAAESLRFENAFSQAPWTKPSIATLFTSLYPEVHGLTNHEGLFWGRGRPGMKTGVLPDEAVTLAELLREGGYRTAAFMTNPMLAPDYGFDQGFEAYEVYEVRGLSNLVMDAATAWIDSLPADQPFFAYLHFMDVHGPYDSPTEDFDAVKGSPSLGNSRRLSERELEAISDYLKRVPWTREPEAREVTTWRARYAAGIRDFDRRFGSFLDDLKASGLLDEAYLVLTSDHGEEFFEHQGWDHGHSLFAHQLHVPLLIRRPDGEGARTVDNVVSLIDLMPTLLSVGGIEPPTGLQGRDLSALLDLEGGDQADDAQTTLATATSDRPGLHAIRTRDYKLVLDLDTGETWLFDTGADPGEQENLAAARPEVVDDLRDRLLRHVADSTAEGALEKRLAPIPDELIEQLRSLGYVQ